MEKHPGPMSPNNVMVSAIIITCVHVISHDIFLYAAADISVIKRAGVLSREKGIAQVSPTH